ncbi:MAG: arginine repressor [Planctomycetota bacterium]|nr:arginine repressor [Planctomycetota bacterium]
MKNKRIRQKALLEILSERVVRSQGELRTHLKARGFEVTQATLSRDIKQLGVVKTDRGYQVVENITRQPGPSPEDVLRKMVTSVQTSHFVVIVHTLSGCASPVAQTLDDLKIPGVLGTVAGDNTLICICTTQESARLCAQKLDAIVHFE